MTLTLKHHFLLVIAVVAVLALAVTAHRQSDRVAAAGDRVHLTHSDRTPVARGPVRLGR